MQVVLSLHVGGLERVVVELVNHASDEFRHTVCCLEEPGAWASEVLRVVALNKKPGVDWSLFRKIAHLAKTEKIDVIHTHNSGAHLYGAIAGKLAGKRVLHTEHGKNIGQEKRSLRLNQLAAFFTDQTVAVSEKIGLEMRKCAGATDKLQVIANGIRIAPFDAPRQTSGRRIGTVGRLVREKNYPLLLRAAAGIPDVELIFVGDGPERAELESLVKASSKPRPGSVQFLGSRSDIPALLAGFDVFALSSRTEGMSIALLEAMAAGCPIVVTAVGGNTELIQHEVTGLVVPPGNEEALRTAISRLLDDRALAARLGSAAQMKGRAQYSVETMTRRYEEIWRRLAT